jgi:hypothetical protein
MARRLVKRLVRRLGKLRQKTGLHVCLLLGNDDHMTCYSSTSEAAWKDRCEQTLRSRTATQKSQSDAAEKPTCLFQNDIDNETLCDFEGTSF